jgi:hypothetical protein
MIKHAKVFCHQELETLFLECDKCACFGRDYKKNYWDGSTIVCELLLLGMKLENPKYMHSKLGVFEEVDKGREFIFILEILKREFLNIFGLRMQPDALSDTSLLVYSKQQTVDQIRNQMIISVTIYQRSNP